MKLLVKEVIENEKEKQSIRLLTIIGESGIVYDGAFWRWEDPQTFAIRVIRQAAEAMEVKRIEFFGPMAHLFLFVDEGFDFYSKSDWED